MGATVREAQERVSSTEFTEWCAFHSLEPEGYEVEMFGMGQISATIWNSVPGRAKKHMMNPKDFYPAKQKRKRLSDAQIAGLAERRKKK